MSRDSTTVIQLPAPLDASVRVATPRANCVSDPPSRPLGPIKLCHFSTVHTELKSRTFHRQCLPLAAAGFGIRYVSPVALEGSWDGIEFIPQPRGKGLFSRLLALPSLLRGLRAQGADVYHFQDTELLPLAFILKMLDRRRVIYDAYEDFPSMALSHRRIPRLLRPFAAKMIAAIERLAAHCFDGIITADPFTMRRFAHTGKSAKLVFHNFPNLEFFPPPDLLGPKPYDLMYRGGLSVRAGTFVLLDALRLLADQGRRLRLSLIGYFDSPADKSIFLDRIRVLGLDSQVTITGRIPHEAMAQALSGARIGISPLQDVPKFRLNLPVKVFEYWACGLPVIASDLPPMRPYFQNVRGGLLFPPGDALRLSRAIAWMLDHAADASEMGRHGRDAIVSRFNNECEVRRLRDFCQRIAAIP